MSFENVHVLSRIKAPMFPIISSPNGVAINVSDKKVSASSPKKATEKLPGIPGAVALSGQQQRRWVSPSRMIFERQELSTAEKQRKAFRHAQALADQEEWRKQKKLLREERQLEKAQNLKMLQDYYPWGNSGLRVPAIVHRQIPTIQEPSQDPNNNKEKSYLRFGAPGHGAPNRTVSGRVQTLVSGDPSIRFINAQNVGRSIENQLRYRKSPNSKKAYKEDLDGLLEVKKLFDQKEKEMDKQLDDECDKHYPFGTSINPVLPRNKPDSLFFSTMPFIPQKRNSSTKNNFLQPINGSPVKKNVKPLPPAAPRIGWSLPPWEQNSNQINGQYSSKLYKYCKSPEEKKEYLEYLKKEMERKREEKVRNGKETGDSTMDLVPLMAKKQVGRPRRDETTGQLLNHHLSSTDVTSHGKLFYRNTVPLPSNKGNKYKNYLEELEFQAKEKQKILQRQQEREYKDDERHFEVWSKLWGRPGHGAPKNNINHRKENLWRLLLDSAEKQNSSSP